MVEDPVPGPRHLHIVYLRDGRVLLSRKYYGSLGHIQDAHEGYMSSLGPWSFEEIVEFLDAQYVELRPAALRVAELLNGRDEVTEL